MKYQRCGHCGSDDICVEDDYNFCNNCGARGPCRGWYADKERPYNWDDRAQEITLNNIGAHLSDIKMEMLELFRLSCIYPNAIAIFDENEQQLLAISLVFMYTHCGFSQEQIPIARSLCYRLGIELKL